MATRRRKRSLLLLLLAAVLTAVGLGSLGADALFVGGAGTEYTCATCATGPGEGDCQGSSTPLRYRGEVLNRETSTGRVGVTYNSLDARLELERSGGDFQTRTFPVTDLVTFACAGDFDKDGWTDFVGMVQNNTWPPGPSLRVYRNQTFENPAPDWTNPLLTRTPKFVPQPYIEFPAWTPYWRWSGSIVCGDFNGDGWDDFGYVRGESIADTSRPTRAVMFLRDPARTLSAGRMSFLAPYTFGDLSDLGPLGYPAVNMAPADVNGDRRTDIVFGSPSVPATDGGEVRVLLNGGGVRPAFARAANLVSRVGLGTYGVSALTYVDVTGDSLPDLVIGGVSSGELRLYPGLSGGGVAAAFQSITFPGAATVILAADFSLDGASDLIVGTENWVYASSPALRDHMGGKSLYYRNNRRATPFALGPTMTLTTHQEPHSPGRLFDFDLGFVIDYDHDPSATADFLIADGNHSGTYYLFANRVDQNYVDIGSVSSNVITATTPATEEATIVEVRLVPEHGLPVGTAIRYFASITGGVPEVEAFPCVGVPGYCASFTEATGTSIMWRAQLASDPTRKRTPSITAMEIYYTWVNAKFHYRAGPVARDGIVYLGALKAPGDRGRLFALSEETQRPLWEASALLDAASDSARKMFTVTACRSGGGTNCNRADLLDFDLATASRPNLQATLGAADTAAARTLITWQRSNRFGLGAAKQRLGAVEHSSVALLTPPKRPYWYSYATTTVPVRTAIDAYVTEHARRKQLVLVGAKDGALHAFHTDPARATAATNGQEAWAFVPYDVARRIASDRALNLTTNGSALQLSAYVDGSPTLASAMVGGRFATVLVSGEGGGGRSVFALDVSETLDATTSAVLGPRPLWHFTDTNMGPTRSKPAVIRTKSGATERWLAVFASGAYPAPSDVGDTVYAVDLTTGELVWRFDLNDTLAHITTDIAAAETDDAGVYGGTQEDGYIDRLFFADNKGRLWQLNAATGLSLGGVNVGLGATRALFSTMYTSAALGAERAIAGTVAVAPDATGDLVVYFGTGGTDDTPATAQNALFAVYAKNGAVRSKLLGNTGYKFYGGVAYNAGQLIVSAGKIISGTGICASTAGLLTTLDANTFVVTETMSVGSRIAAPVYADRGKLYAVTVQGAVVTAGNRTTGGSSGSGTGAGAGGTSSDTMSLVSYRQAQ